MIHFSPRLWGLDMNYKEQIEWLRGFEIDHSPDGWPAIRMREISAMCDAVESLLAENERLNHNLTSTEQTMREYQELAAKRLEEIAKYRDAPVVAWVEVVDSYEGPYHFNGEKLLNVGKHKLIVKPGEEK